MAAAPVGDLHSRVEAFFVKHGATQSLPEPALKDSFLLDLVRRHIRAQRIERGRLTCSLVVGREIVNAYNTLHGGALATAGEEMARACVRTVAGDVELFLGEGSASYLSPARLHETIEADAHIVRQGRRVIVASVEFRSQESKKLLYIYRSTFYALPAASL